MNDTFYRVRTEEDKASDKFPMWETLKDKLKDASSRVNIPEEQTRILSHIALFDKRQFVINRIKNPLMRVMILIAKRLFPVTRENCVQKNTQVLFDIEDKFFEYEDNPATAENNPGREELFRAAFKLLKFEYEHDPYYRYRFDWLIEEIVKAVEDGRWQPRPKGEPSFCWKEPGERKAKHWYTL